MPLPVNVSASLTAQNTFTDILKVLGAALNAGNYVSISLSGITDSTLTLQRRFFNDAGVALSWYDVESWSADIEATYVADEKCELRLGIKTGNYGTDTVVARLGKG